MSIVGILIGILNCILLAAILVLLGAIVAWIAGLFGFPVPWTVQRLFLAIVLLIFLICVISLLLGVPMIHFIPAHAALALTVSVA